MSESGQQEFLDIRNDLLMSMHVASERYQRGKENAEKERQYRAQLDKLTKEIEDLRECGNHLTAIYKNVKSYAAEHQKHARDILDLAILEAGQLVPDADTDGIHLKNTDSNRISVVNNLGQNINLREGGGYRAILGVLLRYAALKAQPDALQLMLLDEYFFTLSDTTTAAMKDIFEEMKKDMTIVCIEQRRNAMDGIIDKEYTFKKGLDKVTKVTLTYDKRN